MRLENQGTGGSSGSHWERTILHNDIMTSSAIYHQLSWSYFNLAILKDTGWYIVNETFFEPTFWGYQRGCEFFYKDCLAKEKFPEFCSKEEGPATGCTFDKGGVGSCRNETFSDSCTYYYGNSK